MAIVALELALFLMLNNILEPACVVRKTFLTPPACIATWLFDD